MLAQAIVVYIARASRDLICNTPPRSTSLIGSTYKHQMHTALLAGHCRASGAASHGSRDWSGGTGIFANRADYVTSRILWPKIDGRAPTNQVSLKIRRRRAVNSTVILLRLSVNGAHNYGVIFNRACDQSLYSL